MERPQDRAFLRQALLRRKRSHSLRFGRARESLREAEVEKLHARLRQHHVGGLQVPVHDPLPVRLVQRVRDLDPVPQRLLERQRTFRETLAQRFSFEILHDQVLGLPSRLTS